MNPDSAVCFRPSLSAVSPVLTLSVTIFMQLSLPALPAVAVYLLDLGAVAVRNRRAYCAVAARASVHRDAIAGIKDSVPILLGIIPFGLIAGIAAVDAGLSPVQAIGMSVIIFAGASQLAAIELLGESAPILVVIATAVVINLRMLMYSASIAPYLSKLSRLTRSGLAYLLVDQVYAMVIAQYQGDIDRDRPQYYLGLGLSLWVVWMAMTAIGAIVGTGVPESLELSFAVPLVFLALLVPAMKDRGTVTAGLIGGTVGVLAAGLPLNLGLPVGAVAGVLTGAIADRAGGSR